MLKLGFAPLRRKSLSATVAAVQRREILAKVCSILPDFIDLVDITDICPDGMMVEERDANAIADKFAKVGVDALFLAFCDFGEECAAATLSARLKVPTLVWGPRDYSPNTDEKAGRDTQCGMFAATKVLARMGVTYSYIVSCPTSSKEFFDGFLCI